MFDIEEFIIAVYLCVTEQLETLLKLHPPRQKGFAPSLSDSEVVTLEIVGEFLGHHSDSHIWQYFRRHWRSWFPQLPCRTTFVRQATNLWCYKQLLHERLLEHLDARQGQLFRIDGSPMPVCGFKRAPQALLFKGIASFGSSATKLGTFYGLRGHLLVNKQGIVLGLRVTAANTDERDAVSELIIGLDGLLLGDKGYINADLGEQVAAQGLTLLAPKRRNMRGYSRSANRTVSRSRQMVETVIGHLCHWFDMETVLARDIWHLSSRLARKVLAHTLMAYLNRLNGRPVLHFADIITQ
jgi:hypothetical protein